MTAERTVRVAVVGVGHLGRHHARVAAALPGVSLVGVHDHHDGRAEIVARQHGLKVLPGPEDVAEAAEAVIVATPTSTHAELGRFFLESGRDVLLEKPIASTVPEAAALVSLARQKRRVLAVGHVERYNPAVEAAMEQAGAPLLIEAQRLGPFTARGLDVDVVLDLMIHDLQIAAALVGRPVREVRAVGLRVVTGRLDVANARILFEGGCIANLTASRVSDARLRRLRIFSPDASLSVDMDARSATVSRVSRDGGRPEIQTTALQIADEEPLAREVRDFVRAVRERSDTLVPGEVGRDALALAQRVTETIAAQERDSNEEAC